MDSNENLFVDMEKPNSCVICDKTTTLFSLEFHCYICSEECLNESNREFDMLLQEFAKFGIGTEEIAEYFRKDEQN